MFEKIIAATVTLVIVYIFVYKASEASNLIKALSAGYSESVRTLQGR